MDEAKALGLAEGRKIGLDEGKKIGQAEGKSIGLDEGIKKGRYDLLIDLVNSKVLSISDASEKAGLTEEEFMKILTKASK